MLCQLRRILLVRLGREDIIGSQRFLADLARKSTGREGALFRAEDPQQVTNHGLDFITLAFLLFVDVLQVGDGVHDSTQTLLHEMLLFLEFVDQASDIVDRAFALSAFLGRVEDGLGLLVAQQDVTSRRRSNLRCCRREQRGVEEK